MSSTTTKVEKSRKIYLTNGQTLQVNSNAAESADTIPTIDIARMYNDNLEDRQALAEEVRQASRHIGFFLVTNHVLIPHESVRSTHYTNSVAQKGVDINLAAETLDQAKQFFALPKAEKMKVCTDLMPDEFCGYHPMEHYNINGSKRKGKLLSISFICHAIMTPNQTCPKLLIGTMTLQRIRAPQTLPYPPSIFGRPICRSFRKSSVHIRLH